MGITLSTPFNYQTTPTPPSGCVPRPLSCPAPQMASASTRPRHTQATAAATTTTESGDILQILYSLDM